MVLSRLIDADTRLIIYIFFVSELSEKIEGSVRDNYYIRIIKV